MTPLDYAIAEIGYTEKPYNRTKFGQWYGLDGYSWCMMFDQWCFSKAKQPLPYRTASCSALLAWYKANRPQDVISPKQPPRPNYIVIFKFGHTGIVERDDGDYIITVEGNTSKGDSGSQSNGDGVYRRRRHKSLVDAYIRAWNESEEDMTGEEIYKKLTDFCNGQTVPNWAKKELQEAIDMGITDGSNPCGLIPRYQAAIMCKRAAQKK